MQGVILAAGAGRRLRPLTLQRSKAMAPICGAPMIERVAGVLLAAGVERFVVVVRDLDDDVGRWARSWSHAADTALAVQPERLGMADALRHAAAAIDGPFLLSACDSLVPEASVAALLDQHTRLAAHATLALQRLRSPEESRKQAIVTLDGRRVVDIVEKPEPDEAPSDLGSLPLYAFSARVLDYLPEVPQSKRGEYEIQDAIKLLIQRDGGVYGYMVEDRWQVTDTADLVAINREFLNQGHTRPAAAAECLAPVHIGPQVRLGRGCAIGPHAVLEDGCRLGDGCIVRRAVVLAGVTVAAGTTVEDTVLALPAPD